MWCARRPSSVCTVRNLKCNTTSNALGGVGIRIVCSASGRLGLISTAQYPGLWNPEAQPSEPRLDLAVILTLLMLVAACAVHLANELRVCQCETWFRASSFTFKFDTQAGTPRPKLQLDEASSGFGSGFKLE